MALAGLYLWPFGPLLVSSFGTQSRSRLPDARGVWLPASPPGQPINPTARRGRPFQGLGAVGFIGSHTHRALKNIYNKIN